MSIILYYYLFFSPADGKQKEFRSFTGSYSFMAASRTTVWRAPQFESCRYPRPQVKAVVFYPTETLLGLAAYQVTLHLGLVITFDQSDGKAQLYVVCTFAWVSQLLPSSSRGQ